MNIFSLKGQLLGGRYKLSMWGVMLLMEMSVISSVTEVITCQKVINFEKLKSGFTTNLTVIPICLNISGTELAASHIWRIADISFLKHIKAMWLTTPPTNYPSQYNYPPVLFMSLLLQSCSWQVKINCSIDLIFSSYLNYVHKWKQA